MREWKESELKDLALFKRGYDLPRTEMETGIIPVAGSNGVIGYHNIATTKGPGITVLEMAALNESTFNPNGWYMREFTSGTKFINGDTLLARITPCLENGKTAYITFMEEGQVGWGSTKFIVMRPFKGLHPFFAYTLTRNADFRDYAESCFEGSSGRQRVNVNHLMNYAIRKPDQPVICQFNEIAEIIVPKLCINAEEISTFEKLRDSLLPKLMSGEVRVEV